MTRLMTGISVCVCIIIIGTLSKSFPKIVISTNLDREHEDALFYLQTNAGCFYPYWQLCILRLQTRSKKMHRGECGNYIALF